MSEQPETESLSIEDRIVAQFDEQPEVAEPQEQQEATEEAAPESEAAPEFVEIEYEGKAYQVPPELKDALLRQSDYTKKTTEVSDRQRALEQKELEVKAFQAEKAFRDSAKEDIKAMDRLDYQIEQYKAVDVTGMSAEDLWKLSRHIEKLNTDKANLANGLNQKWQSFNAEQQKLINEAKQKAIDHVSKSVKGWGPEAKKAISEYALSKGFTSNEVDNIGDPRVVEVLWEAQQYRKLQSQTVQGKVTSVPTVKPGSSNPMPQHVKDQFALKKTLSNKTLTSAQKAKAIERELMNRF
jgi:hypothetical protein